MQPPSGAGSRGFQPASLFLQLLFFLLSLHPPPRPPPLPLLGTLRYQLASQCGLTVDDRCIFFAYQRSSQIMIVTVVTYGTGTPLYLPCLWEIYRCKCEKCTKYSTVTAFNRRNKCLCKTNE